jgi:hypothetical protein
MAYPYQPTLRNFLTAERAEINYFILAGFWAEIPHGETVGSKKSDRGTPPFTFTRFFWEIFHVIKKIMS